MTFTDRIIAIFDDSTDYSKEVMLKQILDYIGEDMAEKIFTDHDMSQFEFSNEGYLS